MLLPKLRVYKTVLYLSDNPSLSKQFNVDSLMPFMILSHVMTKPTK